MSTTGALGKERTGSYTWLVVALLVAIIFAAVDFFYLNSANAEDRQASTLAAQIQVSSQQNAKFALEAAGGNVDSFAELSNTSEAIATAVKKLQTGDPATGMPGYADAGGEVGQAVTGCPRPGTSCRARWARSWPTRRR